MPIYEYECRKCKAHTEVFQKINDKPRTRCPKCKGRLEKLMSASAIRFKGKGWYVTDYAAKGKQTDSSEEKASSSADSGTTKSAGTGDAAKTTGATRKPAASDSAPSSKSSGS
ncbi:MAG: zinc ribbon domain-containing protein [Pyrinomonadaceae bacterium]